MVNRSDLMTFLNSTTLTKYMDEKSESFPGLPVSNKYISATKSNGDWTFEIRTLSKTQQFVRNWLDMGGFFFGDTRLDFVQGAFYDAVQKSVSFTQACVAAARSNHNDIADVKQRYDSVKLLFEKLTSKREEGATEVKYLEEFLRSTELNEFMEKKASKDPSVSNHFVRAVMDSNGRWGFQICKLSKLEQFVYKWFTFESFVEDVNLLKVVTALREEMKESNRSNSDIYGVWEGIVYSEKLDTGSSLIDPLEQMLFNECVDRGYVKYRLERQNSHGYTSASAVLDLIIEQDFTNGSFSKPVKDLLLNKLRSEGVTVEAVE